MAKEKISRSPGSIILELLIAVLIVALLLAILYPKKLWKEQEARMQLSRQRMENLHFAAKFYNKVTKQHTDDINAIVSFAEAESLTVHPPGFKMDRLTRLDSGIDSFVVEYYDPYQLFRHFRDTLKVEYATPAKDSVVLTIEPLPLFSFAPVTKYCFAADVPINVKTEFRGDQGVMTFVGAQGKLRGQQILGEPVRVRASDYIYAVKDDNIGVCPSTGKPYDLSINVKVALRAEMKAILERKLPENPLSSSPLLSSMVIYRLLKTSDAEANRAQVSQKVLETVEDSILTLRNKEYLSKIAAKLKDQGNDLLATAIFDSTLSPDVTEQADMDSWEAIRDSSYAFMNNLKESDEFAAIRDSIINARKAILASSFFISELKKAEKKGELSLLETGTITTIADSIEFYSDPERIKNHLFKEKTDKVTQSYLQREDVKSLFNRFSYTETYVVPVVDSIGITIASPIKGSYVVKERSILDKLFAVSGDTNHGSVVNGDLSWSERR